MLPCLEQLVDQFILDRRSAGRSLKTTNWYRANLRDYECFAIRNGLEWCELQTSRKYSIFLQDLQSRYSNHPRHPRDQEKLSQATVRGRIVTLKTFGNWLVREGLLDDSPFRKLETPRRAKLVPRAVTIPDFDKLLKSVCNPRDSLILKFLIETGCRVSEICNLKIGDLDLANHSATVLGKGSKQRTVYFNGEVSRLLQRYLKQRETKPTDCVFLKEPGWGHKRRPTDRINPETIRDMLDRLARRAQVEGFHNPHGLRHAFAFLMIDSGCDAKTLSRLLGHTNIGTTEIYMEFRDQQIKAIRERHSPLRQAEKTIKRQ